MFKKLFGGDKKPAPQQQAPAKPQPVVHNTEEQDIAFEKQEYELNSKVAFFDNKIEASQGKLEKLDKEIRHLVAEKKKQQAKTKIAETKQLRELIDDMEQKKLVFINMKLKLEVARNNASSVSVIKQTNELMKNQEKVNDDLQDQISDWQEYLQQDKESKNLWDQLAENSIANKEEIDDEYAKYEDEVNKEQAELVHQQFQNIPDANLNKNAPQKNANKNTQEDKFVSALQESLLEI